MQESDPNADSLQETLFDIISKGDHDLINDFLGSNPSLTMTYIDENNQNGLFYAVSTIVSDEKCLSVLQFLIGKGMDPLIIDKFGQSILFYSCAAGLFSTTHWLIEKFQLQINQSDINGQTPFFYAVKENRLQIIQLLIMKGADKDHLDKDGLNCFYMIENNDHVDLVTYLLSLNINPSVMGKNGQQFFKKAKRMGFFKIIDALNGNIVSLESKKQKYVLAHKGSKKALSEKEREALKSKNPEMFRLLEDNEYLKLQMNDGFSSEIVDINNF